MDQYSDLLKGLAAFVTSMTLAVMLYLFAPAIRELSDRLAADKDTRISTIELFGMKMSMQDGTNQLVKVTADLQNQLAAMKKRLDETGAKQAATPVVAPTGAGKRILWVNDAPQRDAYQIGKLRDSGADVEIAGSPVDARRLLRDSRFDVVVTDYTESGFPEAGLDVVKTVRELQPQTPVVIFTTPKKAGESQANAKELGVVITGSPIELELELTKYGVLK